MILGIGHDIVQIARIEEIYQKYEEKFLNKILHPLEQQIAKDFEPQKLIRYLAKRYAAKEAISKAFGTGFRHGITFHDMAILNDENGKPYVKLYNAAQNIAESIIDYLPEK